MSEVIALLLAHDHEYGKHDVIPSAECPQCDPYADWDDLGGEG